jgi:hypothetical protein
MKKLIKALTYPLTMPLLLILALHTSAIAATWYVDPLRSSDGPGISPACFFRVGVAFP